MNPSETERLKNIQFNSSMMGEELAQLPERVEARLAVISEIDTAFIEAASDGTEMPAQYDDALGYAAAYLYRTGNPDGGEDLKRHLTEDLQWQKRKAREGEWLPQSDETMQLVYGLVGLGSRLSMNDMVPAFQPNKNSDRPTEIMDPYDVWYNKYGFLLPGTQTYGSYQ